MLQPGAWVPLPGWARFLIALGRGAAVGGNQERRLLIAISVPTRVYAAPLCALGVVLGRAHVPASSDPAVHFERLRSLPEGAAVIYRPSATKKAMCRFGGLCSIDGKDYAVVEAGNTLEHLVPPHLSLQIEPTEETLDRLAESARIRSIRVNSELLSALLGGRQADQFLRTSRIECVIVGTEGTLREEITAAELGVAVGDRIVAAGSLQDVLRVRRFPPDGPYRSDVASARAQSRVARPLPEAPVVIFDGAGAFVRWSATADTKDVVAVLDRTEPRFAEAVAEANRRYAAGGSRSVHLPGLGPTPAGVEFSVSEEDAGSRGA